jgi:hypothetical protein
MNSPRVIREMLKAQSLPPAQRTFLEEVARYKDACGISGQIPGDVTLSYIYSAAYYGASVTSVVVSLGLYGVFGPLAPGAFLLTDSVGATICFVLFVRRRRLEIERAERQGFRLRSLMPTFVSRTH